VIGTDDVKVVPVIQPVSLNNASGTSLEVDTKGWNSVRFVLSVGATTGAISVFKVQGSATSGGSFADVTGASLSTLPGAADDGKRYSIRLNLRDASIPRYLKVVLTEDNTGTGVYGVDAILGDPAISPNSATERGFTAETLV
jgi:hypothetical protein